LTDVEARGARGPRLDAALRAFCCLSRYFNALNSQ